MSLVEIKESPVNAISIRDSTLGQYLESINTDGTWFSQVQTSLGISEPIQLTALDAMYTVSGIAGALLLLPIATGATFTMIPALLGSTLIGVTAVGMSEEDRRTKIGTGIVTGVTVITNPKAVIFVAKEAYGAGKETVKQSVELAKSSIGLTTAALGLGTSIIATKILVTKRNNKKRKRLS